MSSPVVLVGGGIASVSAARELRSLGYDGPISLVVGEDEMPYDRPPLSKQYLAGTVSSEDIALLAEHEADDLRVDVLPGRLVMRLDPVRQTVAFADGSTLDYSALLVATGAGARRLPLAATPPGVHYLRTRRDADSLRVSLEAGRRLVVVGAGFIGLEVAATARQAGLDVTVVEAASAPLTRVLGLEAGQVVTDLHRGRGVDFRFDTAVAGLSGGSRLTGVELRPCAEGDPSGAAGNSRGWPGQRAATATEHLPADVVVVGVGAVPQTDWLKGSGVLVDDGVVCDAGGRTSAPAVYAAGDASRWVNEMTGRHARVEQWQAAAEQGRIAAGNIAVDLCVPGSEPRTWKSVPYFWSDQYNHKIQFCGTPGAVWTARQTARGWVSCCAESEKAPMSGVLSIDGPSALARGRSHVANEVPWPEACAWLRSM